MGCSVPKEGPGGQNFTDPAIFKASLEQKLLCFVRSEFLASLQQQGEAIMRQQDVASQNFLPAKEVLKKMPGGEGNFLSSVVAMSCRWITKDHPDPQRYHLDILTQALQKLVDKRKHGLAVFWDFLGLPQKPRTPEEDERWKAGLGIMNAVFAHERTIVFAQKKMPDGSGPELSYDQGGWCTFQSTVSGIIKPSTNLISIADSSGCESWDVMLKKGTAPRKPPMLPRAFDELIDTKTFNDGASKEIAKDLYAKTFEVATANATKLAWMKYGEGDGWGQQEAEMLVHVLPLFVNVVVLDLDGHKLGEAGIKCIAPAVARMPKLTTLRIYGTGCSKSSAEKMLSDSGTDVMAVWGDSF